MFGPSYPRGDTTLSCPKRGGRYSRFASKTPSARQYRSMLRGRSSNQKRVALCALWHLVEPAAEEAVQGIASTYSFALNHHPLATKAVTSAAAYGLGDMMAQLKSSKRLDGVRVSNFVISGLGAGVLWSKWYDFLDFRLAELGVAPGLAATSCSILLEQFVWAPVFFGLYFLPLNSVLKWRTTDKVAEDVISEIGPTLWANAKVWTSLNIIIYNAPLPVRVLVSNGGDLVWSAYLSFLVQGTCEDEDDVCLLQQQDINEFIADSYKMSSPNRRVEQVAAQVQKNNELKVVDKA